MRNKFRMRELGRSATATVLLASIATAACVREKATPPVSPMPTKPTAGVVREGLATRDLAGKSRAPRRTITPGALEAESPVEQPPAAKPRKDS
jgi:hypothetical protein